MLNTPIIYKLQILSVHTMASVNNEDKAKTQNCDNAELSTSQQIKRISDDGIDAISVRKSPKLMEHQSSRILQIVDQKLTRQTDNSC